MSRWPFSLPSTAHELHLTACWICVLRQRSASVITAPSPRYRLCTAADFWRLKPNLGPDQGSPKQQLLSLSTQASLFSYCSTSMCIEMVIVSSTLWRSSCIILLDWILVTILFVSFCEMSYSRIMTCTHFLLAALLLSIVSKSPNTLLTNDTTPISSTVYFWLLLMPYVMYFIIADHSISVENCLNIVPRTTAASGYMLCVILRFHQKH